MDQSVVPDHLRCDLPRAAAVDVAPGEVSDTAPPRRWRTGCCSGGASPSGNRSRPSGNTTAQLLG
eukprot:4791176-Alexandrium_andersonii.AAC.1